MRRKRAQASLDTQAACELEPPPGSSLTTDTYSLLYNKVTARKTGHV